MAHTKSVYTLTAPVEPDELKAFQEAIKDPIKRREIIAILEEAGLLGELPRLLA